MTPLPIQTALTSAAVNHITFPCSPQRHFQRKNRGFPAFSCADCTEPDAVFQSLSMPLRVIYFMSLPRWPFLPEACTAKHSGSCSEVFRNFTGSAGLSHSSTFSLPCHRLSFFLRKIRKISFFVTNVLMTRLYGQKTHPERPIHGTSGTASPRSPGHRRTSSGSDCSLPGSSCNTPDRCGNCSTSNL